MSRAPSRVGAAADVPILATTLFFTFSRGAIASGAIAIATYVLFARPRALVSVLFSGGAATAVGTKFAFDASLLATLTPTTAPAVVQGRHVAIAVVACVVGAGVLRALLLLLDTRLERFALPARVRAPTVRTAALSLVALALTAVIALNGTIAREYHRFLSSTAPGNAGDLRARLTDPGNNGRIDMWRVAWRQFKSAPVLGRGAGTFENTWAQHRPTSDFVQDAHSLYMEVLDEPGIVGLLLLLTAVLTVLVRVAARARGPDRPIYAAVFALLLARAIHAGVDWDWEMPVLTLIFFALGGFALAAPGDRGGWSHSLTPRARPLLGLGCVLLAVAPAYVWLSQRKLDQASSPSPWGTAGRRADRRARRSRSSRFARSRTRSWAIATFVAACPTWRSPRSTRPSRSTRRTGITATTSR